MTTKTDKRLEREQRMYDALKRITRYQTPMQLQRNSEKEYGLQYEEALEYAYENVRQEARLAIKRIRRPA
jgi:hypothetical protein